jgi:hypothetical protein
MFLEWKHLFAYWLTRDAPLCFCFSTIVTVCPDRLQRNIVLLFLGIYTRVLLIQYGALYGSTVCPTRST